MAHPRHRQARHKAETRARRRIRGVVSVGVPVGVTATAVTLGLVSAGADSHALAGPVAKFTAPDVAPSSPSTPDRRKSISRSSSRLDAVLTDRLDLKRPRAAGSIDSKDKTSFLSPSVTRAAILGADTKLYTTTELNLWDGPGKHSTQLDEIDVGSRLLVTGRSLLGRDEVVVGGRSRWVTSGYLTDVKPPTAAAGLSMAPCPDGSTEYRLTPGAIYVYRSVCHAFPQTTTYGGYDNHGEHASGKALDIMTSDVALGNAIRDFLVAHAAELNLYDVIWQQHIFTQERASEGLRFMPDRGSATANHYDHVHVSVY